MKDLLNISIQLYVEKIFVLCSKADRKMQLIITYNFHYETI